jgi:hypothetical protein
MSTGAYLPNVLNAQNLLPNDINVLENALLDDVRAAIAGWNTNQPPTDAELTRIAIGIQLWGGREGRHPIIRGGGFGDNFNVKAYREIIGLLLAPPALGDGFTYSVIEDAVNIWMGPSFRRFGVSFATKHFSFWSQAPGMPTALPIYDSIMAQSFMGYSDAQWGRYWSYVDGMREDVARINARNPQFRGAFTIIDLERQLYVWATSGAPAATAWPQRFV